MATGQLIIRPKIRELPVTDLIIEAVEQLAERDGIKTMKFSTVDGLPFEDPAWIAGVDDDDDDTSCCTALIDDGDDDDDDDDRMPELAAREDSVLIQTAKGRMMTIPMMILTMTTIRK